MWESVSGNRFISDLDRHETPGWIISTKDLTTLEDNKFLFDETKRKRKKAREHKSMRLEVYCVSKAAFRFRNIQSQSFKDSATCVGNNYSIEEMSQSAG